MNGITSVVSPLISLMKDQVNALVQQGISSAYINSSLTNGEYEKVIQNKFYKTAPQKEINTNTYLNGGIDCRAEFIQNEDADAGKLTLVKEKNEVPSKLCRKVVYCLNRY